MSFKIGDPFINNFDFLKSFGTLYDLWIDLLNEKLRKEQNEMTEKIEELKNFTRLEEVSITKTKTQSIKKPKTKTQRKIFFAAQKSVLENTLNL